MMEMSEMIFCILCVGCLLLLAAYLREAKKKNIYRLKAKSSAKTAQACVLMLKEKELENAALKGILISHGLSFSSDCPDRKVLEKES